MEAAAEVFRGRDPSDVSFEEVAEAGGVSRSLVYAYFGDRGGLIAAVYLHNLEQLDRELGQALDDRLPDEVRLRRIIRRYLAVRPRQRGGLERDGGGRVRCSTPRSRRPAASGSSASPARGAPRRPLGSSPAGVVGLLEAGAQDWVDYRDSGLERATDVLFAVLWEGLTGLRSRGLVAV